MSNKRSSKEKTMPKAKKIPNLADSLPQGSNTMKALTDVQIHQGIFGGEIYQCTQRHCGK